MVQNEALVSWHLPRLQILCSSTKMNAKNYYLQMMVLEIFETHSPQELQIILVVVPIISFTLVTSSITHNID